MQVSRKNKQQQQQAYTNPTHNHTSPPPPPHPGLLPELTHKQGAIPRPCST